MATRWSRWRGRAAAGPCTSTPATAQAATALALQNLAAFSGDTDYVVVNSAGCGALLKDYGHLLGGAAAEALGAKVRDVSELLAAAGPRPGAPLELEVAYDAPCHLQHAQRVHDAPLAVLRAIPGLRLQLLPGSDQCCGSAGIYSVLQPEMARAVLDRKIRTFADAKPRARPGRHRQSRLPDADRRRPPGRAASDRGGASGGAAGLEL